MPSNQDIKHASSEDLRRIIGAAATELGVRNGKKASQVLEAAVDEMQEFEMSETPESSISEPRD